MNSEGGFDYPKEKKMAQQTNKTVSWHHAVAAKLAECLHVNNGLRRRVAKFEQLHARCTNMEGFPRALGCEDWKQGALGGAGNSYISPF